MRLNFLHWIKVVGLRRDERIAYYAFSCFYIMSFLFLIRWAIYVYVFSTVIEKILKILFYGSFLASLFFCHTSFVKAWIRDSYSQALVFAGYGFVFALTVYGIFANGFGEFQTLLAEALFYLAAIVGIIIGGRRIYMVNSMRLLLYVFYAGVIVMLLVENIELPNFGAEIEMEHQVDEIRRTSSLSFQLKSLLQISPFLFLIGMFWKERIGIFERLLYLLSIVPYAYFNCLQFKFRSGVAILTLTFMLSVLSSLNIKRGKQLLLMLIVVLISIGIYFGKGSELMRERFQNSNEQAGGSNASLVEIYKGERFLELTLMWESLNWAEVIIGKGFGGWYDASERFGDAGQKWMGLHIGFLGQMLFGGIIFTAWFLWLFVKAATRFLSLDEKNYGLLLACKLYVIVEIYHFVTCPISARFTSVHAYIPIFLVIGLLMSRNRLAGPFDVDPHFKKFRNF